jgi:hypothetical protein
MTAIRLQRGPKDGSTLVHTDPGPLLRVHATSGMSAVVVGPGDEAQRGVVTYTRTLEVDDEGRTVFAYQAPSRHQPGGSA